MSVHPSVGQSVGNAFFLDSENEELSCKPVAKRHQMVSGFLALLYGFFLLLFFSYFDGSRAAAPVGEEVL